jgi:hypothetical protein
MVEDDALHRRVADRAQHVLAVRRTHVPAALIPAPHARVLAARTAPVKPRGILGRDG